MSDVPILCFHPPTPPAATKPALFTPLTPPASPPLNRPPPPSLEPDAPSDALEQMEMDDDDDDAPLNSPPLVLSPISDHGKVPGMRLGVESEVPSDSISESSSWPPSPSTPSLSAARDNWISAQSRRASASARGEFKIPKHEQDWAAAERYVASLEESLMALYRCLEEMDIVGSTPTEGELIEA